MVAKSEPGDVSDEERERRLAFWIGYTRAKSGLTVPELAQRVGRSRSAVLKWEKVGKAGSTPSIIDLGPLCRALGINPQLFADLPPIPEDPIAGYFTDALEDAVALGQSRARRRRPRGGQQ